MQSFHKDLQIKFASAFWKTPGSLGMDSFLLLNIGICGAHFKNPKILSVSAYFLPPYFITPYTAVFIPLPKS